MSSPYCRWNSRSVFSARSHNLLGPPSQQNPVVCERDMVPATAEQLHPQLLLQLHQLPGEGGLGDVEQGGGPGDVLLAGRHQKIAAIREVPWLFLLYIQKKLQSTFDKIFADSTRSKQPADIVEGRNQHAVR